MEMQYILASASPRRRELLAELIEDFEVRPSFADEHVGEVLTPQELVLTLAKRKAEDVASLPGSAGKIVIGSDTVVAFEEEVLGKPQDEQDAFRMLKMLSGKKHAVYTGVCFACVKDGELIVELDGEKTDVYFRELSDQWIWDYIRGGSPMDKAGAYGIQDGGLVDKIEGSYTNVVGFPIEVIKEMMEKWGKEHND